jgi:hypothetical protein
MSWEQRKNIVFLFYNPYSCGKFLGNILSYNKSFVPQFPLDGNRKNWYSKETYDLLTLDQLLDIKHETIIKTIPPTKKDCKKWREYELGCKGFWGFDSSTIAETISLPINLKAKWFIEQELYCYMVFHDHKLLPTIQKKFPNSQIVKLINDLTINKWSQNLKNDLQPEPIIDMSKTCKLQNLIEFDIGSLFDKHKFFNNIYQLLKDLSIEDTSLDLRVDQYYQSYCDLYQ